MALFGCREPINIGGGFFWYFKWFMTWLHILKRKRAKRRPDITVETTNVKVFDVVNKTSFWFNCYFIVNSNLKHDGNFSMNVVRAGMLGWTLNVLHVHGACFNAPQYDGYYIVNQMGWLCSHCQMNVNHCCQMAHLVAEKMGFGQGRNSPSHTFRTGLELFFLAIVIFTFICPNSGLTKE